MRPLAMRLPPRYTEFVRFGIVGCINVAVSFLGFMLFYRVFPVGSYLVGGEGASGAFIRSLLLLAGIPSLDAAVANVLGYMAGMLTSFTLNKIWTFRAEGNAMIQATRFVILNLLGLVVSSGFILVTVDMLGGPYLPFWIIGTVIVMVLNYLGNRHWTFA